MGIILIALRTVLGLLIFIIGHILPDAQIIRNILSKLLCFTFGIIVYVVNQEKKEDVEAFISNQISIFDHLVVHTATNSVTVCNVVLGCFFDLMHEFFLAWSQAQLVAFINFWHTKFRFR